MLHLLIVERVVPIQNNNIGYLIYIAHVVLSKYFNNSIHKILPTLTGVQFTILIYLYYHRDKIVTQREITDYLHLRHPTVRHIIKLILKKHLIVSGPLPTDHRQVQLMISNNGNQLIKSHLPAINHDYQQMNQIITNHMDKSSVHNLEDLLTQLIKNFEE